MELTSYDWDVIAAALQYSINHQRDFVRYLKHQGHEDTAAYAFSEDRITQLRQEANRRYHPED
jgi:hypothetical protein